MTSFDLYVVLIGALSVLFGWARGLSREVVTLLALAGGFGMVAGLATPLSFVLGEGLTGPIAAILLLFLIGFVVVQAALELGLRKALGPGPRRPDRLAGIVFGGARAWLLWGLGWLAVTIYFDGEALPPALADALTRAPAAAAAEVLTALGVDEVSPPSPIESSDALDAP